MSDQKFILVDGKIRPASFLEWAKWFEAADRHIAKDYVDDLFVSTVFLGIDHSFGQGQPLLFETMVLRGDGHDEWMERTATVKDALAAHERGLTFARALKIN